MPKPRTGTIETCRDRDGNVYYRAKIRLADGSRPRCRVPSEWSSSPKKAKAWALDMQKKEDSRGTILAERNRREGKPIVGETFRTWSVRWLAARSARGYTSVRDDRSRLETHIMPALRDRPVAAITRDEIEAIVDALDMKVRAGELHWRTSWNVWAVLRRAFKDAEAAKQRDLRVRTDNPCDKVAPPDRGVKKAKQFLYPSEFLALMNCERVPIGWRRMFAVAVYLFPRAGELEVLEFSDLELERGQVHIHRGLDRERNATKGTKTGIARRFAFDANIIPVLEIMKAEAGERTLVVEMPRMRDLAEGLRNYLKLAGVTRAELFTTTETRKQMTFHDLRATGISWMAVRGDEPLHIQYRAGHTSFSTTQIYIRQAEAVREGFGTVFPALDMLLASPTRSEEERSTIGPRESWKRGFRRGIFAERAGFEPAARF
jgi:integrase